jgi:UDP-glucose 4-epimerase
LQSQLNNLGIDYVIHLAAAISVAESMKMPEKYDRINVDGSRKVGSPCMHRPARTYLAMLHLPYENIPQNFAQVN